jgi:EAL domain-containing protein (putative c-di-GMP-specific phosphodiesterase class I)
MPVVNTSALSERIANWVMETACWQARAWELSVNGVRVAINLSPSQLHSGDLAHSVAILLAATGLTPSLLELEVTEDILLHDEGRVLDMFKRIQELGVRILFDDFGIGYASLSYLKKFPLDGLKIDARSCSTCSRIRTTPPLSVRPLGSASNLVLRSWPKVSKTRH